MKKKICIALVAVALILAALLGVFHRAVYLVFRNLTVPVYALPEGDDWDGGEALMKIPYSEVSASDYLDLYLPRDVENPQLFVLIHGGGFIAGDSNTKQIQLMYRYFRDRGYACASVNYRLADEAPFPAAIEDCKAAIRYLRANAGLYGYDAERIVVFGESAGGYLATMCAVTDDGEFNDLSFIGQAEEGEPSAKVDVLVDYYPHTDLTQLDADLRAIGLPKAIYGIANGWMNGKIGEFEDFSSYWFRRNVSEMREDELRQVDPFAYLDAHAEELADLSVWMIHGDCDITIPYPASQRLYARFSEILGEQAVRFRFEPNMGHASDPLYSDEILAEVDEFIRAHLKG